MLLSYKEIQEIYNIGEHAQRRMFQGLKFVICDDRQKRFYADDIKPLIQKYLSVKEHPPKGYATQTQIRMILKINSNKMCEVMKNKGRPKHSGYCSNSANFKVVPYYNVKKFTEWYEDEYLFMPNVVQEKNPVFDLILFFHKTLMRA